MTNSYLPASFTGFLSWPVRRDDAPESKSDRILTMGIVGGIILFFIVPPTWYFIARTIRLRRARAKGKDVEQGAQSQRQSICMNTQPNSHQSTTYSALYNYSPPHHFTIITHQHITTMTNSNLSASFTLVRPNEVEELPDHKTTYLILGICSGVWLCIVLTWYVVKCCRKRKLKDVEQGPEPSTVEAGPR
ncbi:hypothetical protein BKA60DRAFT_646474 [Fusarium oxysporum]|nr:hypothetical protein BKA60DRAFT_646474 [Fusarium oxysporum]